MAVIKFRNPNGQGYPGENPDGYPPDHYRDDGQEFIDEQIEESENSRKRRRAILRLVLHGLIAAACAALIAAMAMYLASQRVYSAISGETVFETSAQEDVQYLSLGNHIVYYSKDGASCLTGKGAMVWSISFEMQEPVVSCSGEMLAIADYNGSTIYLQNATETLGSISTNLPVRDLCVSESGRVAAVLADTDVTWIYLFDAEGNTVAYIKTTMSQSGYPVGVALSPGGELLGVSHLITDSTGISSSVAFYNFGSVGQNFAENNVSGFNYEDEIFPCVMYLNDSTCIAVSDARIVFYTGKEIPQSGSNALFTQELEGVYVGDEYVALLFPDSTGEEDYLLQVYDVSGSLQTGISFSMEFTQIQLSGNSIYINNDTELMIYSVSGQLRFEGDLPTSVSQVIPTRSGTGRLYAVTEEGIERLRLQ